MNIGIFGAEKKEIVFLQKQMNSMQETKIAGLTFYTGILNEKSIVLVCGGIGKVNAALCTQILISEFKVSAVINTGTAGGLLEALNIFDIVVSTDSVQHDVDASAFGYELGQVPMTKTPYLQADKRLCETAAAAFKLLTSDSSNKIRSGIKLIEGRVASGDTFIAGNELRQRIINTFHPACVEMEGAAVAQVCCANQIPHLILRSISDTAGKTEGAKISYEEFSEEAAVISAKLVFTMLGMI